MQTERRLKKLTLSRKMNQKQTTTQMTKPFVRKETEAKQNEKQILHNQCTFGNTRLSDNSRIRAILEFLHPHHLHRSATVK